MELEKWAAHLQQEVYKEWKTKYSYHKAGFKVFYSKPRSNPELMIISYNPGGNHSNFENESLKRFKKGDFSVPNLNSYADNDHRMSKKVRSLFIHFKKRPSLLEKSVIFPLIYFRSKDTTVWRKVKNRRQMEKFCFEKDLEIIRKLNPKKILVIGFKTYSKLKKILNVSNEIILCNRAKSKHMLAMSSMSKTTKLLIIPHLTGSRMSTADFNTLGKQFEKWCTRG